MRNLKIDSLEIQVACLPDTDPPPVTIDVEETVEKAAQGQSAAVKAVATSFGSFLYTLVLGEVLYEDEAAAVLRELFGSLRCGAMGRIAPRKGCAMRWLANVTRAHAKDAAEKENEQRRREAERARRRRG